MKKEDLSGMIDSLYRQARRMTAVDADAEDLVSETLLRAMAFLDRGGDIEHPAAWLRQTMAHVRNDVLRKQYRQPVIVELTDELPLTAENDFDRLWESDEEEAVRHEVNRLASEYRQTLILRYWRGLSVAEIASRLGIPEGTVKSRLDAGRQTVRKGLEQTMNESAGNVTENERIPETLFFSSAGTAGPAQLVEGDDHILAQNILIEAWEKPLSLPALSRRLGVPTVYLEPEVRRLLSAQLMAKTPGGLVYTDFIIFSPADEEEDFRAQLAWAERHFDKIWPEIEGLRAELDKTDWRARLNARQADKAFYHAALRSLQQFTSDYTGMRGDWHEYYRGDPPQWLGWGYRFPAGYDFGEREKRCDYRIQGGHRSSVLMTEDIPGVRFLALMEFDVTLLDRTDPPRFFLTDGGFRDWQQFKRLLWRLYKGEDPAADKAVPTALIEAIPRYVEYGLLVRREDGSLTADIPVLTNAEYSDLFERVCPGTARRIDQAVGDDFRAFVRTRGVKLPPHLKSVPESLRYFEASVFISMAILREAYRRGLFLPDADGPVPPVVAVFEPEV